MTIRSRFLVFNKKLKPCDSKTNCLTSTRL